MTDLVALRDAYAHALETTVAEVESAGELHGLCGVVWRDYGAQGLDLQADGGTHVANTREVGAIRVTGYESKDRINKRIRIELANPAHRS
jgi:alanyl-tRNA synthetase